MAGKSIAADATMVRKLLKSAKEFHFAAELCRSKMDMQKPESWLLAPQMTNYALASELALKGLQGHHLGIITHGHDLEALCKSLPAASIDKIRGPDYSDQSFWAELKKCRRTFEEWRYTHEAGQIRAHLFFIQAFARSSIGVLHEEVAGPHSPL